MATLERTATLDAAEKKVLSSWDLAGIAKDVRDLVAEQFKTATAARDKMQKSPAVSAADVVAGREALTIVRYWHGVLQAEGSGAYTAQAEAVETLLNELDALLQQP